MTNEYQQNTDEQTRTRPHSCHCAPDAPCRVSGKCTCMNSLLKKLEETSQKKPYRVLVGDDDEMVRTLLSHTLRNRRMEVDLASTADEVIAKAKANKYAAVVTDLEYTKGGRQGYDVLKTLKDLPTLKVLYTGRSGFEFTAEGLENGADYVVLSKDHRELIKILDENSKN